MLTANEVIKLKADYFFPNSLHFYRKPPLIVSASGKYMTDAAGKRYTDFFAGVSVVNCGHCNNEIDDRVIEQIRTLSHTSLIYLTQNAPLLAQRLAQILPGDIDKTFFCNSGTEANEGALLLARMHTGRKGFLAFEGGLHGRSALTTSVTGIPMWRIDPFPEQDVWFAKGYGNPISSERFAGPDEALRSVSEILKEHGSQIAACIVEPIQGNAGINVPPPDFFIRLKSILESYGVLLIADEVQTGFARTGRMFACENFGVVPDIITMAKALGNGYPIGAFSARTDVAQSFNKPSASTLGGNPVSMAAGLAVLDFIESANLCARAKELGVYLISSLRTLADSHNSILDVRGMGLMVGVELESSKQVDDMLELMKDAGFIIGKNGMNRNVLAFQPPLIIDRTDIDEMIGALKICLTKL